jgi:hypothetical protein
MMRVSKLVGAIVGLGLGLVGMGASFAGEPPVFTADDIKGVGSSELIEIDRVGNSVMMATSAFVSKLNIDGELFVVRGLAGIVDVGQGRTLITSISQANCDTMRVRSMGSRLRTPGLPDSVMGEGEWTDLAADSALAMSCSQARADRSRSLR